MRRQITIKAAIRNKPNTSCSYCNSSDSIMRIQSPCLMIQCIVLVTCLQFLSHVLFLHPSSNFLTAAQNLNADSSINSKSATNADLYELTDKQLEEICTQRGFELVKESDKETGNPIDYSHQDYVDAARQCLEIEAEMERILKDNPHLLEDIEAESKRMMEEKKTLEEKLKQTQTLVDEKKKKEKKEKDEESDGEGKGNNATGDDGSNMDEARQDTNVDEASWNHLKSRATHSFANQAGEDDDSDDVLDLDQLETKVGDDGEKKSKQGLRDEETSFSHHDDRGDELQQQQEESTASLVEKGHSSMMNIRDIVNEYKIKFLADLERISSQYLPEHVRKQLLEMVRPVLLILQSMGQTISSMVRRYCVLILEGAKKKIDTTLVGFINNQ